MNCNDIVQVGKLMLEYWLTYLKTQSKNLHFLKVKSLPMFVDGLSTILIMTLPRIYRRIYDPFYDSLVPSTIPHAVVILADYSYKSAFVADQEINLSCVYDRTHVSGEVQVEPYELKEYLNSINKSKENLMDGDDPLYERSDFTVHHE